MQRFGGRAILPAAGFSAGSGERSSPSLPRVATRQAWCLAGCLRHEGPCGSWVFDRAAGVHGPPVPLREERVLEDPRTVENPAQPVGEQAGLETRRRRGRPPHMVFILFVGRSPISPKRLTTRIRGLHGTRKDTLLESVPPGVTTWTFPVVAPVGTVVAISEGRTTVNTAGVRLKVTLVAPVRLVPRILMAVPASPEVGRVATNGPRPTDRLKTVPSLAAPPPSVVP